ncbi:MAG: tetratricopeptide repeat protein [Candidatus Aminicenantes bacterium]|nr:tetratricopeptide repeat protein [Candidatus Aminicenantes bacterium]
MTHRTVKAVLSLSALIVLAAGPAFSQAGHGKGRLGGSLLDPDGKPVPGIKMTLTFSENKSLVFEDTTGKKGEWSFIGLGTGNWILAASIPGYQPVEKIIDVSQLEVNPKVQVVLKRPEKIPGVLQDEKSVELLEQGNELYKDGKYDEAISAYRKFQEANPGLYQIQISIADCYREKGEFDKALALYNEAIAQSASDAAMGKDMSAKALAGIGNCYLKQGKLEEAQGFFQKSIETSPKDEILAYNVGEIYFSNQALDQAVRYFELAAQIKPSWPDPFLKLGYVYLNKADNAKAAENFEKFLALEPEGERAALAKNILGFIKK